MCSVSKTEKAYGFLWKKHDISSLERWHFDEMQDVIDESIVRGSKGIDVGSGCGYDTYIMASRNPSVDIVSIDLSNGIFRTKELTAMLRNVHIIKCSVLDMPLRGDTFDFAYSFGVLHHIPSPASGLREINRILKKGGAVFLYLYEDHSENFAKFIFLKPITILRKVTTKLPHWLLFAISCLLSPLIFGIFSLPSKVLSIFKRTQKFIKNVPFNFGKDPFSLRGDLFDRFSAPLEHRFSRYQVHDLLTISGFSKIKITKLKNVAGWVALGYKI